MKRLRKRLRSVRSASGRKLQRCKKSRKVKSMRDAGQPKDAARVKMTICWPGRCGTKNRYRSRVSLKIASSVESVSRSRHTARLGPMAVSCVPSAPKNYRRRMRKRSQRRRALESRVERIRVDCWMASPSPERSVLQRCAPR